MLAILVLLTHEFNLKGTNRGARVLSRGRGRGVRARDDEELLYEEQGEECKRLTHDKSTSIDPRTLLLGKCQTRHWCQEQVTC